MKLHNCSVKRVVLSLSIAIIAFSVYTRADTIPGVPIVGESPYNMYCWAASTKSLCTYYDPTVANKTLANVAAVYTTKDEMAPTDTIAWVIRQVGKNVKLGATWVQGKMSWADVKKEIDAKRPFIFLIRWGAGGQYYHCNVLYGYIGDSTKVRFMDAGGSGSKKTRTWTQMVSNNIDNNNGIWECSYLTTPSGSDIQFSNTKTTGSGFEIVIDQGNAKLAPTLIFNGKSNVNSIVRIFDMKGVCVQQVALEPFNGNCALPIRPMGNGIYVARCIGGTGNVTGSTSFCIVK